MKKRRAGFKLNRNSQQRSALLKSLLSSLVLRESITTTLTKAKAVRPLFERLITMAKANNLASRRRVQAVLQSPTLTKRLFEEIVPRYQESRGGYTSLIPVGNRAGDNAPLSKLSLTKVAAKPNLPAKSVEKTEATSTTTKKAVATAPQPEKIAPVKAAPKLVRRTGKRGDK